MYPLWSFRREEREWPLASPRSCGEENERRFRKTVPKDGGGSKGRGEEGTEKRRDWC